MINYTKRYVNIISLLITILVYIIVINSKILLSQFEFTPHLISSIFKKNTVFVELKDDNINQGTKEELNNENNVPLYISKEENKEIQWKIIIPKISLEAEICEGTSKEVMNRYVGHFKDMSTNSGNIGLAAHNRGYDVNYFADIKKLKNGDEIIYKYYDFEKTYIVFRNIIIKDTDWNYLEQTEENIITLITCIENEPEYRRCVQAIEK